MAYGGGPAEWAAMQQRQRQQQLNNILQMFMAMKQYQNEQGWKQREWENKQQQQVQEKGFEERRITAYEGGQRRLLEQEERIAAKKPEWFAVAEMISQSTGIPIGQILATIHMPKPTQGRETPGEYAAKVTAGEEARKPYQAAKEKEKTRSAIEKEYKNKKIDINKFYDRKILDEGQRYDEKAQEYVQNKQMKYANAVMSQKQQYLRQLGDQRQGELNTLDAEYHPRPQTTAPPAVPSTAAAPQAFPKVPESKVRGQSGKLLPDGRTIIKIDGTWFEVIKGQ